MSIMTINAATNDGVLIIPATEIVIVTALEIAAAAPHALCSTLRSIIVHTCPERTLVASQADPHAFVPDATHPPSFVF
jgi:hypothetical protein